MSLVHWITDGQPLADAIDTAFPGLPLLAETPFAAEPPVRPRAAVPREHFAEVGGIIGQRLADLVQPAPPYPALLGAARCEVASLADLGRLACAYPTHRAHGAPSAGGAWLRPTPSGWWQAVPPPAEREVEVEAGLLDVFHAHLQDIEQAAGRIGPARDELARIPVYRVLNLLEGVYRGARDLRELQAIADTGEVAVGEELSRDVAAILQRQRPVVQHARELAADTAGHPGSTLGYAAPVLVPGWAEGDVLLGPRSNEYTLIDVKTVTSTDPDKLRQWLRQLVAYACCDVADRWRIRRIGLWLPRQACLVHWPITLLSGSWTAFEQARREIAAVAADCAARDGADPTLLLKPGA